jgi:hypothetical protein
MTIRQGLTAAERKRFPVGAPIRYKPGVGVYGFEDCVDVDGRIAGVVLGHVATRVRIELTLTKRGGSLVRRAVNAASLILAVDVVRENMAQPVVPHLGKGLSS